MVCSDYNSVVMERNTDVDETVSIASTVKPADFGAQFRNRIDLAIALAPRSQDFALIGATRAKVRVGYTYVRRYLSRLVAPFYLTKLAISSADPELSEKHPNRAVIHEVDQLLEVVGVAGARERVEELRIDLRDADRLGVAFLPPDPLVFHLGTRWFTQGSTLETTMQIVSELRAFGHPLVVTYGPECKEQAATILAAGIADAVVGGLPFHAWAAAFERARCIVTVDTGATHVASAVRRPTVVAFEHRYFRLSSQEWAPYRVQHALVRKPAFEDQASLAQLRRDVVSAVASLI
jgi:ADP-heptose:LPS heptosyltransferase